jgi:hypothetical protein
MSNPSRTRARRVKRLKLRDGQPLCHMTGCWQEAAHFVDPGGSMPLASCEAHWPAFLEAAREAGAVVSECVGPCCAA